jgi:hypothetical protein
MENQNGIKVIRHHNRQKKLYHYNEKVHGLVVDFNFIYQVNSQSLKF